MIPVLYPADQLTYTTNGIGRLVEAISCKVTEELNGIFELEMEYPVNGKYYPQIQSGGIIGVIYNGKLQPFDIYKVSVDADGICTVNAAHVSNRLGFSWTHGTNELAPLSQFITNLNGSAQVPFASGFSFTTDITSTGLVLSMLMECTKSLVARIAEAYGGEIEYDNYDVKILTRRGTDTGIKVAYGKNVDDLSREHDWSGTWNAICPYWFDEVEGVGGSGYWPYNPGGAIQVVSITPVKPKYVNFYEQIDHYPTLQELHDAGVEYMNTNKPWIPKDTTQATVLEISDNDPAQALILGDTITVVFTQAGITLENARVVGVEYNVLLERNNAITVGTPQREFVEVGGLEGEGEHIVTYASLNSKLEKYALKTDVNSLFSVSTVSNNITIAANSANDITINGSKSGYKPLGVVGVDSQSTGSASVIIKDAYVSAAGDGTVSVYMQCRNVGGSAYTGPVVAYVLWQKTL